MTRCCKIKTHNSTPKACTHKSARQSDTHPPQTHMHPVTPTTYPSLTDLRVLVAECLICLVSRCGTFGSITSENRRSRTNHSFCLKTQNVLFIFGSNTKAVDMLNQYEYSAQSRLLNDRYRELSLL